jgi:hypothetical protein
MSTLTYSGITSPQGIAVDTSGNLYVADSAAGTISLVPSGGTAGTTLISGLSAPLGLALDYQGNIYVSLSGNGTVMEYQACCLSLGVNEGVAVGSGYSGPVGVAVDAAQNIYVSDTGNHRIVQVTNPLIGLPNASQSTVVAGLNGLANSVTVAPTGDLVYSVEGTVYNVNRTTQLPKLTFPGTAINPFGPIGATSPPQTLTISSVGNQQLELGVTVVPDFPPVGSAGVDCLLLVYPGQQCSLEMVFTPQGGALGPRTGTTVFVDNAITGGGKQKFAVKGTALYPTTITFLENAPVSAGDGKSFQVEAQESPGGALSFSSSGVCKNTPATPMGQAYVSTYTMTSGIGTCSVIAKVPASGNNSSATATETVIASQNVQKITFAQPPNVSLSSKTVTLTATASSSLPVNFISATPGVCTVSGSTATLLATGKCTIQASQPGNDKWSAAAPVTRSFTITP